MIIRHSLLAAAAIVITTLHYAAAQSGDMPGPRIFDGQSFSPPPASCHELLALRDESELYAAAIEGANARKLNLATVCRYFRSYNATVEKMLRRLEANGPSCGVPSTINDQVRSSQVESESAAQRVCDAAWPRPASDNPPANFDDPVPPFKTYLPSPAERPRPLIIDPIPLKMGSMQRP